MTDAGRRKSDGSGASRPSEPAVQIRGFHVEGQQPQQLSPNALLQEQMRGKGVTGGSPAPVIVPPSFQRDASGSSAAGAREAAAAAETRRQEKAEEQQRQQQQQQQTSPQKAAGAGGAGGAGAGGAAAPAAPAAAAPPPPPAQAAGPSGRPGGDQRPAVPTSKQPLTKAERRAKQEAERAAKAAAKAGGGGGGGGKGGGGGGKGGAAAAAGGAAAAAAAGAARAGATGTPSENRSASAGGASAGGAGASQQQQAAGATAAAAAPTATAAATPRAPSAPPPPGLELFAHLPPYRRATPATVLAASASTASSTAGPVHPAVLALALRYADGTVSGGDARCLALLEALSAAIRDYRTPEGRSLRHHLTATVNAAIDLLVRSRPLSAPMGNAVKLLKLHIGRLDPSQPEDAAKEGLLALLQEYAHEKIVYARRVLVQHAVSKVRAGDVVLTYGYSSTVVDALLAAHAQGVAFSAVVVDGRPDLEGRAALSRLLAAGIPCTYAALSGLALVTRQATKVMLGASAVLSNGAVLARAGTASVALAAHSAGVPVLVLTASHKFHERVQLDSITHNELGDPEALAHLPFGSSGPAAAVPVAAAPTADEDAGGKSGGGKGGGSSAAEAESAANNGVSAILGASGGDLRDAAARAATLAPADRLLAGPRSAALAARPLPPRLGLLNLRYDLTPADLVTVVTTEFGHLPPTSVPVILREFTESAADAAGGGGGGGGGGHGHGHHHHGR